MTADNVRSRVPAQELIPAEEAETPKIEFSDMIGADGDASVDEDSPAPLAIYSDKPSFNPEDVTPPMLKLMQPLSPAVVEGSARGGQWELQGFAAADSLTIVPISFARRREYRAPDDPVLACASFDGETGEGTPGGICADCPMNKWTGEGKNRRGPQCQFMYSYMVYAVELDSVAIINFRRTGLGVGRTLNSMVNRAGMAAIAVKLESKLQSNSKGSFYIPKITPIQGEEAQNAVAKAKALLGA
jgi:hypothetical protein